jgi:preprotein translocase subunit SecB
VSDPRTLAAEVGAKADLLGIALRSASAELTPPEDVEQLQMSVSWETSFERLPESQVEYRYRIAVTDAQTEAFSVRAEFALTYALESTAAVSDEHLEAFGEVSVVFSAFPYARELIQSLTSRASLPPLVLERSEHRSTLPARQQRSDSQQGGGDEEGTDCGGRQTGRSVEVEEGSQADHGRLTW